MTTEKNVPDRYCRACGHALRGVASRACPECGAGFDPDDPRTTTTHPFPARRAAARVVRACVRLQVPILIGMVAGCAIGTDPLWLWLSTPIVGVLGLVTVVGALLPGLPLSIRGRVAGVALPLLILSVPPTGWPFRVAFGLHRATLDAFVRDLRAEARPRPTGPLRIGIYRIRTVLLTDDGHLGLQLTGDAGGGVFLVHTPPQPSWIWFNTNWVEPLGGDWYRVQRD